MPALMHQNRAEQGGFGPPRVVSMSAAFFCLLLSQNDLNKEIPSEVP